MDLRNKKNNTSGTKHNLSLNTALMGEALPMQSVRNTHLALVIKSVPALNKTGHFI